MGQTVLHQVQLLGKRGRRDVEMIAVLVVVLQARVAVVPIVMMKMLRQEDKESKKKLRKRRLKKNMSPPPGIYPEKKVLRQVNQITGHTMKVMKIVRIMIDSTTMTEDLNDIDATVIRIEMKIKHVMTNSQSLGMFLIVEFRLTITMIIIILMNCPPPDMINSMIIFERLVKDIRNREIYIDGKMVKRPAIVDSTDTPGHNLPAFQCSNFTNMCF